MERTIDFYSFYRVCYINIDDFEQEGEFYVEDNLLHEAIVQHLKTQFGIIKTVDEVKDQFQSIEVGEERFKFGKLIYDFEPVIVNEVFIE